MQVIRLSQQELLNLADELTLAAGNGSTVRVAVDGAPHETTAAFKVKVNGGVWSPGMGTVES